MCQGFSHFSASLHHFVLAKLANSSIRVKDKLKGIPGRWGKLEGLVFGCVPIFWLLSLYLSQLTPGEARS